MKRLILLLFAFAFIILQFSNCKQDNLVKGSAEHLTNITAAVNDKVLVDADKRMGDWMSYGRNYQEDRNSTLDQITKENINELGLAWATNLGTKRGLQATPLVVDGIMYFSGPWNVVWALDARTGEQIWKYDPIFNRDKTLDLCCGSTNRGLAMYKGDLFMGTLDGRLISIDAATGTANWEVMTIPEDSHYSITGAPRVVKGKVIIGNGGAEIGARGYVTAYDAATGEQEWRFYTVPGNPADGFEHPDLEEAVKTWNGEWWTQGGGGTVWDAMAYDPDLNQLYIGVGNGAHWDRNWRSPEGGDNLYLSSIVSLNPDDGSYNWHYQTTPGDSWDYTATQHLILADMEIDGSERKVIMQAPKNGFFYVIDRTDGSFISADNFVYVNWASGIDENGRPIENPGARYEDGQAHWISPSSHGGHNWPPMTFNPATGLVYIPTANQSEPYVKTMSADDPGALGGGFGANVSLANRLYIPNVFDPSPDAPAPMTQSGRLIAWDPIKQEEVWGVDQVGLYNGGLLSTTTGLIFQGDAEGMFSIYDADNGEKLWSFDVRSGAVGSPITYIVDGEQYVTILVGWGGYLAKLHKHVKRIHPGTVYTFKLGGNAEPPEKLPALDKPLIAQRTTATPEHIGNGFNVFTRFCIHCHPQIGAGDAAHPDIGRSSQGVVNNFEKIVMEGILLSQGMPSFEGMITKEEVQDVKDYILYTTQVLSEGMSQTEYLTNIAQMQYLADQKAKVKG